ncbi:MAG: 2-oxoglutarate dehydrogenase complex dihydrolipoyllysine-residue succinyltransferase, partial [Gammaproteobacteria bacterium]|nr:2-oxoglutarate dehydrogenase complex dihydrolipoyllysine-residue succinyltransferase [Gammaproteobacteria bacterium]
MLVEVKVPMLAESVAEATLMTWHKQVGDEVKRGDSLIDIETDKVTLEVAAPNNGVLSEIIRKDGETVTSDEVIAHIDTEGAASGKEPAAEKPQAPEQQELPVLDEAQAVDDAAPKMSPSAKNLVENFDLDASRIKDANNDGRLTKEDVLKHLEENEESAPAPTIEPPPVAEPAAVVEPDAPAKPAAVAPKPAPAGEAVESRPAAGRNEERVKMTRLRQRIAERLLSAQHENAILTTFNEVNMQPVMDLRQRYQEEFEKTHGVRLGYMSFFTKAAVEALKKFPVINASVDGTDILYHNYFDIGIAVSSPRGLVVPILRDADTLTLAQVESKIREMGEKAQQSTLTMDELTGGTFTITNGGVFGSLVSTPIINPPQSAILGMHKIQQRPV